MPNAPQAATPPVVQLTLPLGDWEPQQLLLVLCDQVVVLDQGYEVDDVAEVVKAYLLLPREGAEAIMKDVGMLRNV